MNWDSEYYTYEFVRKNEYKNFLAHKTEVLFSNFSYLKK